MHDSLSHHTPINFQVILQIFRLCFDLRFSFLCSPFFFFSFRRFGLNHAEWKNRIHVANPIYLIFNLFIYFFTLVIALSRTEWIEMIYVANSTKLDIRVWWWWWWCVCVCVYTYVSFHVNPLLTKNKNKIKRGSIVWLGKSNHLITRDDRANKSKATCHTRCHLLGC